MISTRSTIWLCGLLAATTAQAASPLKTLYDFTQSSGGGSTGEFIVDGNGIMYGTASDGGAAGFGTVFKFNPATKVLTVLYNFQGGADGAKPAPRLIMGKNDILYGVTEAGGATNSGTVFKLNFKAGVEQVIHSFGSGKDGATPRFGLVLGQDGELYGTTYLGGKFGLGTIFRVDPVSDIERVLLDFNNTNGADPSMLTPGPGSLLYGTTYNGGSSAAGVIYSFDTSTKTQNIIYSPSAIDQTDSLEFGVVVGPNGFLYGVSTSNEIYQLDPSNGQFTVLYAPSGSDYIYTGPLAVDASGNLYGTALLGTLTQRNGWIFQLVPSTLQYTVLYTFRGPKIGKSPSGLVFGKKGLLYGGTLSGGNTYHGKGAPGYGILFSLKP